ncbi:lasso peptide biosynthesis B2 protein [Spirosoma gilvum]
MKNWWKRFKKFWQLSLADQFLLIRAFFIVLIIQLGLKLLSFQTFREFYSKLTKAEKSTETPRQLIDREIQAIRKVSGPLSAFCLPQALALTYFLRKDKHIDLVVGVRKSHTFEAHAWVEKNGTVLIGDLPDLDFQPLWTWH